jgi:uncharacterized membrane protein YcaP (DUF421 family)
MAVFWMMHLLEATGDIFEQALGLHAEPGQLTFLQMTVRATVVFIWGVILVRLGDRRLLGKNAGFDVLLVVVLGSVLSRAINGQSAFFPTLGVSGVLILLHHGLALAASRSDRISQLLKGMPVLLVKDGRIDEAALKGSRMSRDDLDENVRLNGNVSVDGDIKEARLERNGTISVVKHSDR